MRALIEVDNKKKKGKNKKKVLGGWKWCLSVKVPGGFVSCSSLVQQHRRHYLLKWVDVQSEKLSAWCLAMRRCFSFSSYKFRIIHVISSLTTKHAFSRQWVCWLQKQFLDGTCIGHWGHSLPRLDTIKRLIQSASQQQTAESFALEQMYAIWTANDPQHGCPL